ncbi:MAG TPA: glutathione S-transferase C-terminal domain-containing protein [Nevskia sp.]|jgi:glutathione S-transferase|nr:glutathione S-transferase C-terminal domain-containing protein [Nevskia sp.]
MLTLYYIPMACSLAARIALLEAGVEARYRKVDLASKRLEDGSDFHAVNPKGRVATLQREDGSILTENIAILLYIAARAEPGRLAPDGGEARFTLLEWLSFIATELHKQCLHLVFSPGLDEALRAHGRSRIEPMLTLVERRLAGSPFIAGESFSVADAYLVWALLLARHAGGKLDKFPAAGEYVRRACERPAVREALLQERPPR